MPYSTDEKAEAIVYAALHTDREAADKCGTTRQSIYNWRNQLDTDQELQKACSEKWREIRSSGSWVQDATRTIRKAEAFIRKGVEEMDASDPRAQEVMGQNLKILAESLQMARIVDARLGTSRQNGEPGGQNAAGQLAAEST